MRQILSNSFRFSEPDDIARAQVVEHLQSSLGNHSHRQGYETWACAWAPDYSYFAWSCGNRIVQLLPWNRSTNCIQDDQESHETRQTLTIDCGELVWSVAFGSGTSKTDNAHVWTRLKLDQNLILATGLQSGRIKLWNCGTGHLLLELLDHKDVVRDIDFAPDGSLHLASASRDGTLKLWDLNMDGNMYRTLRPQCKWVYSCSWSPNKKFIASSGNYKCVVLWDVEDPYDMKVLRKLEGHYHDVVSCEFSPDSALLATASYDTRVIVWDPYTGDSLREFGHLFPPPRPIYAGGANDHYVRSVSLSADGVHIASVSDDGYVRFWNLHTLGDPPVISENTNALCCAYSPGGAVLAVGTRNGEVTFYRSDREVTSLLHLTRMKIRKNLPTPKIDHLSIPIKLKEFLKYHDV
ncbi:WD repeat and SOCS box-containing protein 1-like [Haliotis asinina]|uniref:WD repeat and SOCS box-containing protein 1-like n=1 Tax=Haliotis asinina TaxID=109174 RepID=UPI0035320D31